MSRAEGRPPAPAPHGTSAPAGPSHAARYLAETCSIAAALDVAAIEAMAAALAALRDAGGRLFLLGVGGSAANASHATNDFRKLAQLESYCASDNIGELTARTNDEGWDTVFRAWLQGSRLGARDGIFVLSVGGGDAERGVSGNLVQAVDYARSVGATVFGIVGRDGGHTARAADHCIIVPTVNEAAITPHAESFQAVIWHLLVSHPLLLRASMKWEGVAR